MYKGCSGLASAAIGAAAYSSLLKESMSNWGVRSTYDRKAERLSARCCTLRCICSNVRQGLLVARPLMQKHVRLKILGPAGHEQRQLHRPK
jgi:hypothetical protein